MSALAQRSEALRSVAAEAAGCQACELWEPATQTVFGAGPADARIMLVGEQPGDREDLDGAPFVGPAGRLLDDALERAGIDRAKVYLTNAVKHFKFAQRGKRRLHQKPNTTEVVACHRWIESELDIVQPHVVVLMGTVAVRSVLGRAATITSLRGTRVAVGDADGVVTVHPSAILRSRSDREPMMNGLIDDLRRAGDLAAAP
jgi:uracil-DNA glycosylase